MRTDAESGQLHEQLFDSQAAGFDRRAGLPEECCQQIARAVVRAASAHPNDLLLEIGPGTGQIGAWLETLVTYVGLDSSARMLDEFRDRQSRAPRSAAPNLIHADATAQWPIAADTIRVFFGSRVLHLLQTEHVAAEVFRTGMRAGSMLILGRVRRDRNSVRARMAREMIHRLNQHGCAVRQGEREAQKLAELCRLRGAVVLQPFTAAVWMGRASPRQSLESWRQIDGLAGALVPLSVKRQVLAELETWANQELGGLDRQTESEEAYVIWPIRIFPIGGFSDTN